MGLFCDLYVAFDLLLDYMVQLGLAVVEFDCDCQVLRAEVVDLQFQMIQLLAHLLLFPIEVAHHLVETCKRLLLD